MASFTYGLEVAMRGPVNFRSHAPDEAHPQNAGPDPTRDSQEISDTAESKLTRRAFVTTVSAIAGGIMMGLPGLGAEHSPGAFIAESQIASAVGDADTVAVGMTINGRARRFSPLRWLSPLFGRARLPIDGRDTIRTFVENFGPIPPGSLHVCDSERFAK
jgi:hypothetical protein